MLQSPRESARRGGLSEFVLTIRESVQHGAAKDGLKRFGFTSIETDIATALARGETPKDITALRKTSIATTRWHIRQIYEKMQVKNVRQFLREVGASRDMRN